MKKTTIYTILFLILFAFGSRCEEAGVQQQKLMNIQSQLSEEKQKLKLTKAEEQRALTGLYVIKKNLFRAQRSLHEAKGKVSSNEKKISDLKKQYSEAESNIKARNKKFRSRMVEVYKSGSGSILEIIFASKSMADFVNRLYYFGRVIEYDAKLIGNIREQVETIKKTRVELESSNKEIKDTLKVIQFENREIARSSAEKERVYLTLRSRRQEYERRVKQLEASSGEIEKFIQSKGRSAAVSTGRMSWPISGRMVSKFGYRRHPIWGGLHLHTGIDIAAPYGKPIVCADSGEVIFSGWWGGYGKAVVIDHGRGYTTVYGHMSRVYMQAGQKVDKAQIIGLVGSTGFSTGPHLHFEVRYNGRPVDPTAYL